MQVVNDMIVTEFTSPVTIPNGLTISFDLNNHIIEQDDEEIILNDGILTIYDSNYTQSSDSQGIIKSKYGF